MIARVPPSISSEAEHFWCGGAEGRLQFLRCGACGYYVHPPVPICPECLSSALQVEAVSGRATVFSYTITYPSSLTEAVDPYLIAQVEIDEQAGLRLTTNIVDCPVESVAIGMPVVVKFEQAGEAYLPVFVPADTAEAEGGKYA